jgi:hypothetical protein
MIAPSRSGNTAPSRSGNAREPMDTVPAIVPLIASGLTVLIIIALVAVASGGTKFVLEIALAVMVAGFAACFWMIQHLSTRRDAPDGGPDTDELEMSVHDLPRDNPARAELEYTAHAHTHPQHHA